MKNKGLWIPAELLEDENLTLTDQHVIATVLALDGRDGCYASAETLAAMNRCSVKSVRTSVRKGVALGYLIRTERNGLQIYNAGEKSSTEKGSFFPPKEKKVPLERENFSPENGFLPYYNNKTDYYTRNTRAGARSERERGKKEEEKTAASSFLTDEFFAAALAHGKQVSEDPSPVLLWQTEGQQ